MYLNYNIACQNGLSILGTQLLHLIHSYKSQKDCKELKDFIEQCLSRRELYEEIEQYIQFDSKKNMYKLSPKGTKLYQDLQTYQTTKEDTLLADYLIANFPLTTPDRSIGSRKNIVENFAKFRQDSGMTPRQILYLLITCLSDENEMKYTLRAEYLLHKKENAFSTKFFINDSRLYQYYERYRGKFDEEFEKY